MDVCAAFNVWHVALDPVSFIRGDKVAPSQAQCGDAETSNVPNEVMHRSYTSHFVVGFASVFVVDESQILTHPHRHQKGTHCPINAGTSDGLTLCRTNTESG